MIKRGAYLTTSYKDILEKYPEFSDRKPRRIKLTNQIKEVKTIKQEYKEIYSCLGEGFYSVDKIAELSGRGVREVINKMTLMEIEGLVIFEIGKGYKKKEE